MSSQLGAAQLGALQLGAMSILAAQSIIPSAVGPNRSIPSPVVAGPITLAAAVGPHRSIPSPTVEAPVVITMTTPVGPHRSFSNPVVAGPITLSAAVGPLRSIPSPTVKLAQTVTLAAAVGPHRSIGSPTVAFVKVIAPASAVAGPRAIPSPEITGGPQYVNVFAVVGARNVPAPALTGGEQDLRIFLGGVDVTQYLSWQEQFSVQSQTIGRWRANFAFEVSTGLAGFQPELGQQVFIVDHSYRVFSGCITSVDVQRLMMTSTQIKFFCQAADKSAICDHRVVTGKTYAVDTDVATVILDICANFLNGEGIIIGPEIAFGAFGTLTAQLFLNFPTVTNAFDQIAQNAGLNWWVDNFLTLHFSPLTDAPASPFGLTETSNNWRNLSVRQTTTDYYNKIYAVSNRNILPGSGSGGTGGSGAGNTESFTWGPDNPGVVTITDGSGTRVAVGINASTPIGSVQSLTVDGVTQTVVDYGAYAGQTPAPPDLLWFWAGPATGSPGSQCSPSVLPMTNQVIVIQYLPAVSTSSSTAQYGTALVPTGDPLGTCGSGIYEGVLQVQNTSDQADLDAIAAAALTRIGGVPHIITFETDYPGLVPGQKLNVNVPLSGANNLTTLITGMSGVAIFPDLGHGGAFRWQVECRTNLDPGNWSKWYERLIARTNNPLPVLQYEEAAFVVPASSTLSSGVNIANPYIVGRTGRMVELLLAAATPPVNQDLTLILQVNSGPIIGQITLPAGTPANQLVIYEFPETTSVYVFARDVLNVSAIYSVTGTGTPVRAAGVTLKARWAM